MRYRYLIERGSGGTFHLCTVDGEGLSLGGLGDFPEVPPAMTLARELEPHETIKWKAPPRAWQPDALYVSQYLDDGVVENVG